MSEVVSAKALPAVVSAVEWLGGRLMDFYASLVNFLHFLRQVATWAVRPPYRISLLFSHMEFIGNQSLNIVIGAGIAVGAVFGLQIGAIFVVFRAESMMGAATGKALCQELAPLITAILITGRAGAAMTAELATMKVNEQVDAMEAMATDPISYLVVPRVLASMLIMPLLCSVFIFTGVLGSYLAGTLLFHVDEGLFVQKITTLVKSKDIWRGLSKALVFAGIMALICCRYGLRASGGAKGVGIATTNAVVVTLLSMLAVDVMMTYIQVMW